MWIVCKSWVPSGPEQREDAVSPIMERRNEHSWSRNSFSKPAAACRASPILMSVSIRPNRRTGWMFCPWSLHYLWYWICSFWFAQQRRRHHSSKHISLHLAHLFLNRYILSKRKNSSIGQKSSHSAGCGLRGRHGHCAWKSSVCVQWTLSYIWSHTGFTNFGGFPVAKVIFKTHLWKSGHIFESYLLAVE